MIRAHSIVGWYSIFLNAGIVFSVLGNLGCEQKQGIWVVCQRRSRAGVDFLEGTRRVSTRFNEIP